MAIECEPGELAEIIGGREENAPLISLLEEIQARYHYLPREALILVSERLGVPLSQVYSVATFYSAFSLKPRGKYLVRVCQGTACHVRGAERVLEKVTGTLHVRPGETTPDRQFTVETVNCLGACALGPVMVIDDEYFGQMSPAKADSALARYCRCGKHGDNGQGRNGA